MSGLCRFVLVWCLLCGAGAVAQAQEQEERLEEWQRRLLDALEDAGRPVEEGAADAWRGTLDDEAAAAAAEKARRRYGGRVLAVGRVGDGYRVRLLLDDGRVITTEVPE
ncbi:MAG: hypothetical protein V2I24_15375 [Halieaceae bacterium]|nr:hypothetical protein [Halieaceae bacterium]